MEQGEFPAVEQSSPAKPKAKMGMILLVQCIACLVALLGVLLLRAVASPVYEELKTGFQTGLQRNEIPAVLAYLWDGPPESGETSQP